MLELCPGLQPFRSRLAFDAGAIAGLRSVTATLGCAVTALALCGTLEEETHAARVGLTMRTLHSRLRNGESRKIDASDIASGIYLESTLAQNRGREAATLNSPPTAQVDLSLAESYRCTQNKANSLGIIFLQKKVGGHPSLK